MSDNKSATTSVNKPTHVLHVLGVLNMGGAESRIMDIYRNIDRNVIQFDFLVHTKASVPGNKVPTSEELMEVRPADYYDAEVRSLGGHIYALPRFTGTNGIEYKKAARQFFALHHDAAVIEAHMTSMAGIYLPIAKQYGNPVTIAHVRSAGVDPGIRGVVTKILRSRLPECADELVACSKLAGEAVYGKNLMESGRVRIIPNAIDLEALRFDGDVRKKTRTALGIPEDAFVIGHVGRFDEMKNQKFLVDTLKEINDPRCRLLMVGTGVLKDTVEKQLADYGLSDQAIFAGQCEAKHTHELYQAMDAFVFPSLYEGLPGTVIEAQAAGLPCFISDAVTSEVAVTELVKMLSLGDAAKWVDGVKDCINNSTDRPRAESSDRAISELKEDGFSVRDQAAKLTEWYLKLAGRE